MKNECDENNNIKNKRHPKAQQTEKQEKSKKISLFVRACVIKHSLKNLYC